LGGVSSGLQGTDYFPYLYLGDAHYKATKYSSANAAEYGANHPDRSRSVLQSQQQFMDSGNENIHHWAYLLALAGYNGPMSPEQAAEYSKTAPMNDVFELHLSFLKDAANLYGTGKKITPQQYLKQLLDYRLGDQWNGNLKGLTAESASKLGTNETKTTSQTTRSVDLMSNEDAKGLVRGMLQQELGRDPTQAEYEDFVATLHSAQRANPSISTATQTVDENGNSTQSVRSRGGLNEAGMQQALYEDLRKKPAWGEWQAVGTYAPALFAALGATV
jgi:hypothetical protein